MKISKLIFVLLLTMVGTAVLPIRLLAGWELPSIISSNMVLQQETAAPLWGWDAPGTKITVLFRGQEVTTQAGEDGKWQVRVTTGKAGGPFVLRIKGSSEVTLEGVLVGEVWVAGGQSNMWWHEGNCKNADQEKNNSDYPQLRIWDANTSTNQGGWSAVTPQHNVQAVWKISVPSTVADFPGVPFFFARELHRQLKVPVGIVHVAVPGTAIETFLSPTYLAQNWPHMAAATNRSAFSCFYNGMVAPVLPFAVRGFLWWQGEGNATEYSKYRVLFPSLIEDWRQAWEMPAAPFFYVELANFLKVQTRAMEDDLWPALRDAQKSALALDQVWEVSAIDILDSDENIFNIHPSNKQLVGHRLFLAAMANVYGDKMCSWSGPRYRSVRFKRNEAILSFDYVGGGLVASDDKPLKGFAIAGADHQFYLGDAHLNGNTVVVTSTNVPIPVAVRYDWANNPFGNLGNKDGLPAFPFRTDHWNLTAH